MATFNQVMLGLKAQPYRPITVHLNDGTALTVDHPEFCAISPAGREMVIFGPDASMNLIDMRAVTLIHIPGREPVEATEGGGK